MSRGRALRSAVSSSSGSPTKTPPRSTFLRECFLFFYFTAVRTAARGPPDDSKVTNALLLPLRRLSAPASARMGMC